MVTNASIDCDLSTSIDMVTSFQYIIPFNCNSVPITSILPQEETSKRKKSESLVNLLTRGIQCFVDCKKAKECINTNVYNPQKHCYVGLRSFRIGSIANVYIKLLSLINYTLPIDTEDNLSTFGIQLSTSLKCPHIKNKIRTFLNSIFEPKESAIIDEVLKLDGVQVLYLVGRDFGKKQSGSDAAIHDFYIISCIVFKVVNVNQGIFIFYRGTSLLYLNQLGVEHHSIKNMRESCRGLGLATHLFNILLSYTKKLYSSSKVYLAAPQFKKHHYELLGFKQISWDGNYPSDVNLFSNIEECKENNLKLYECNKDSFFKITDPRFYIKKVLEKSNRNLDDVKYDSFKSNYNLNTKIICARASLEVKNQKSRHSDNNEAVAKLTGKSSEWDDISEFIITGTKLNWTEIFKHATLLKEENKDNNVFHDISDIALVEKELLSYVSINTIRHSSKKHEAHLPDASAKFGIYCWRCNKYMTENYLPRFDALKYIGSIVEQHYASPLNSPLLCLATNEETKEYKQSNIKNTGVCTYNQGSLIDKIVKLQHREQIDFSLTSKLAESQKLKENIKMKNTYLFFKWILKNFVDENMQQVYLRSTIIGHRDYLKTCHTIISNVDNNNHIFKNYLYPINYKELIGIDNSVIEKVLKKPPVAKRKSHRKPVTKFLKASSDDDLKKDDESVEVAFVKTIKRKKRKHTNKKIRTDDSYNNEDTKIKAIEREDMLKMNWISIERVVPQTRKKNFQGVYKTIHVLLNQHMLVIP